jgi:hypothetical protein
MVSIAARGIELYHMTNMKEGSPTYSEKKIISFCVVNMVLMGSILEEVGRADTG